VDPYQISSLVFFILLILLDQHRRTQNRRIKALQNQTQHLLNKLAQRG
jgi:hypothetical protein